MGLSRRVAAWGAAAGLAVVLQLPVALAGPDPHEVFESRCTACHGHAGAFVRENLTLADGVLQGLANGRAVAPFLAHHRGGAAPDEVAVLVDMFQRQLAWGSLFETRCRDCHRSARGLALQKLIVRDGVLRGRYSGRDIAVFLKHHGRTTPAEQQILGEVLLWQLQVAGRAD